jgi:hypothetical protein
MVDIIRYNKDLKSEWNLFLLNSKNGTFMLNRDYMDYHSDRFQDHSLMFYNKNKIIGILPANEEKKSIFSHGGLTYGGLITSNKARINLIIDIIGSMINYYKKEGFEEILYKSIPYIYHDFFSDEDLYALFKFKAEIYRRDISTVIDFKNKIKFSTIRKRGIKKAKSEKLVIIKDNNYKSLLEEVNIKLTKKYKKTAVHSYSEIKSLSEKFPNNIIQYSVYKNKIFIAGCLLYVTKLVVHAQYIISNTTGHQHGALDFLFDYLINEENFQAKYFDFGISTEKEGKYLNEGLIQQKESFGGRAVNYDAYRINING